MKTKKIKERKIIREGYKLMKSRGYHNTSIDVIIEELNISKNTFYTYFKSKDDFTVAILYHYITIVTSRIDKTLYDYYLSPKQRLIKLYSDYIDYFTNKGGYIYGSFASNLMYEMGKDNPTVRNMVSYYFSRVRDMHIDCILMARRAGEIEKNKDPEKLANLIIYSWEGAIFRVSATDDPKSLFVFRELLKDFMLK